MKAAPKRGAGDMLTEEGPRRVQPTKALRKSIRDGGLHSAPAHQNQPQLAGVVQRDKTTLTVCGVVIATTTPDDPEARERLRAHGARAGLVLGELKQWLRHQELKHPPANQQEIWLAIGLAQFNAIEASRPRWTFGRERWIRRYLPVVYRSWTPERIDALAEAQHREGTYYAPEQIGTLTGVTREAYLEHRFQAIWPAGMTETQRVRDQLDHKAAWQRADNLAKGKVKKPHALSLKRIKPWMAMGISETTWKRRRRDGKLEAGAGD